MNERPPAVAGSFYPADPNALRRTVASMLQQAPARTLGASPYAVIVPHAGYRYSGPIAATAYAPLAAARARRVALFGPSHFAPLDGAAASGASAWRTPLGAVATDDSLRAAAVAAGAPIDDEPHQGEHALEVQLPWLQVLFGEALRVLPVAVGTATPARVAELIGVIGDEADLVVISTDLSHYLPVDVARVRDRRTVESILDRDPSAIDPSDACGVFALRGMVELARVREMGIAMLGLGTSAEATGDPSSVVGYGAFAIGEGV
jgi:hypothetical protein